MSKKIDSSDKPNRKNRRQSKQERAQIVEVAVQAEEVVAPKLQIGETTNDDWQQRQVNKLRDKVYVSRADVLNMFQTNGQDIFTPDAWKKYISPAPGRHPLCCWLRPDDAILIRRGFGILDEDHLDNLVHQIAETNSVTCNVTLLELKLLEITAQNSVLRKAGKQVITPSKEVLREIQVPAEKLARAKFTPMRVMNAPAMKKNWGPEVLNQKPQRLCLFENFERAAARGETNIQAGLYGKFSEAPWYVMVSVLIRPDKKLFPLRGAPWFVDYATGQIMPRSEMMNCDSPLAERLKKLQEQGIRIDPEFHHRRQMTWQYHEHVKRDTRRAARQELEEFHELAQDLAWEEDPTELGLDTEFTFENAEKGAA